jgi:hypothetical protein
VVLKVDQGGDAVGGACFSLLSGTTVVSGPVCDEDGDLPDDGRIGFFDVPTGSYTLRETRRPSNDYFQADDRTITIVAGDTVTVQVENVLRPGRIVIRKVDARDGSALAGACFSLDGPSGAYDFCDSDETGNDGLIRFDGIAAGDYTLSETLAPDGFQIGPNVTVTIRPGRTTLLTIQNQPMPPPAQVGNLTVTKVNQGGSALAGACFSLRQGAITIVGSRCDSGDGASDGVIRFTGVGVGAYQLHETQRPSAAYEAVADVSVTITQNQTTEVRVENRLKPGRILIIKTDAYGNRLQNACFDVVGESGPAACTNANGELFFENIAQGTYSLTETQAPAGYVPAADRTGIVVNAGTTTVITIQNQRVPPPANTGTVQIFKFTCPAGAAGEYTQFIDSSNPGPSRLAQTAGCVAANAEFTMIRLSGEGGPGAFATGGDGFYQTNVQNGTYTLTETNPDLPGESSEAVTIYTNQLTTVVVLNFIAPPAPAPVTINVAKYTCLPGYAGSIYGDFVANCASDETLTNNITFRTSGAVASKRITGDGGQKGRTSFGQIPAGQYTLSEETPFGTATVYAFCGTDPNAPNIKYVGGTIGFSITAGQTVHCTFFNVPPDLTPTTGTILVHKLVCATTTPPPGYDWYNECAPQSTGVGFSIALYSGETKTYAPVTTATTDIDGLVRFSLLQPGQYQLKEIGGEWCHAESNSVDPKGDVIVRAQTLSEVWIFNCVITKAGPNTGTGSAAGLLTPGGAGGDGLALALSLLWPVMGLALYGLYRGRSGRRMARLTIR